MGKIQVDDEFLCRHMQELEKKIIKAYPDDEELTHKFSKEFERKMEKYIKRVRQKEKYGIPIKTGGRIAAAIALVFIGVMAASLNSDALNMERIKTKLYEYTQVEHKKETEKRYYATEEQVGEFVPLYPTYIPEGYELVIEDGDETFLVLSYENERKDVLFIEQDQIIDGMAVGEDNEYIKEERTEIQEYKGRICYKEDGALHIWWESENIRYVVAADTVAKEDLLKVCESLKAKK